MYRVTSVAGHVFNTDFPEAYRSWDSVDPAELFSVGVVKVGPVCPCGRAWCGRLCACVAHGGGGAAAAVEGHTSGALAPLPTLQL